MSASRFAGPVDSDNDGLQPSLVWLQLIPNDDLATRNYTESFSPCTIAIRFEPLPKPLTGTLASARGAG